MGTPARKPRQDVRQGETSFLGIDLDRWDELHGEPPPTAHELKIEDLYESAFQEPRAERPALYRPEWTDDGFDYDPPAEAAGAELDVSLYGPDDRPDAPHPRDYQLRAILAVVNQLAAARSTIVNMPTGTGKTWVFAWLARLCRMVIEGTQKSLVGDRPVVGQDWMEKKILILVHREELLQQAYDALEWVCVGDTIAIERARDKASPRAWQRGGPRVVIASVASLCQPERLKYFTPDDFGLVIIDECHHCVPKNRQYWSILKALWPCRCKKKFAECGCDRADWPCRWVGVTATPDRKDEEAMGQVFETVAYSYEIQPAIDDGWLVPIIQQMVVIDGMDLSWVKRDGGGDLRAKDLERELKDKKLYAACDAIYKLANTGGERRPTLCFFPTVDNAKKAAEILCKIEEKAAIDDFRNPIPDVARSLDGKSDKTAVRKPTLDAFKRKDFQFLCGCALFTEGFDAPLVRCVAVCRPTSSRSLYAQMIGRGTRPRTEIVPRLNAAGSAAERRAIIAADEKKAVLVIDLVGNAGKHKLVTTADILGGVYSDEVIERAKQRVRAKGRGNMSDELRLARQEQEEEEKRRRAELLIEAKFRVEAVDPFNLLDVRITREPGWFKGKRPTEKMAKCLERNKIDPTNLTFWQAKKLLDEIFRRRDAGECSYAQARALAGHGVDAKGMTFGAAKAKLDELGRAARPAAAADPDMYAGADRPDDLAGVEDDVALYMA